MNKTIPWTKLCALIAPFYPTAERGRPPRELEQMLRIHFLQNWFNLSDPGAEEALYDSLSMRAFAGIDLGKEPVPDETTICKFRHLLEEHSLGKKIFEEMNAHLQSLGWKLSKGTIVDATIIDAPSSTKNEKKERDPEMHSTKKGNQWYFGMKAHIGMDARTKIVHSLDVSPANVHDSKKTSALLHGKERAVWGDGAYLGQEEEVRKGAKDALLFAPKRTRKTAPLTEEDRLRNKRFSRIRSRVEHAFGILKNIFGFVKVRYRGLLKNANRLYTTFALVNLYLVQDKPPCPTRG